MLNFLTRNIHINVCVNYYHKMKGKCEKCREMCKAGKVFTIYSLIHAQILTKYISHLLFMRIWVEYREHYLTELHSIKWLNN